MTRRLIVIGAGSIGFELSIRLKDKYQICLLDTAPLPEGHSAEMTGSNVTSEQDLGNKIGLWFYQADGTSRLVLKSFFNPALHCSLLALTGSDEVNLEAAHLAKQIGYLSIIVLENSPAYKPAYVESRLRTVSKAQVMADYIERILADWGAVRPSNIGLGKGELIEVHVTRTSAVLQRPLKNLSPHRWRVAAVFRDDTLVVPTGETVLQVGDRVLLVGDPEILPIVADYFRLGTPQFPEPYGINIVTLEYAENTGLFAEASFIATSSMTQNIIRGNSDCLESQTPPIMETLTVSLDRHYQENIFCKLPALQHPRFAETIRDQNAGVVVTLPLTTRALRNLFGLKAADSILCDEVQVPVLFSRSSQPYQRVLLPISGSRLDLEGAELAIDLARLFKVKLTLITVDLPAYISGLDEDELHDELAMVKRLCELYDQSFEYLHRQGNPLAELLREASPHDLVVLCRWLGRRDTYFNPDVALRVARQAPCSVMVVSVKRKDT